MFNVWALKIDNLEVEMHSTTGNVSVYTDPLCERYAFQIDDYYQPSLVIDTVTHEIALCDDVFKIPIYVDLLDVSAEHDFIRLLAELIGVAREEKYKVYRY